MIQQYYSNIYQCKADIRKVLEEHGFTIGTSIPLLEELIEERKQEVIKSIIKEVNEL